MGRLVLCSVLLTDERQSSGFQRLLRQSNCRCLLLLLLWHRLRLLLRLLQWLLLVLQLLL